MGIAALYPSYDPTPTAVIASEAKQSMARHSDCGLLRRLRSSQ
jgi:hypothetical protein